MKQEKLYDDTKDRKQQHCSGELHLDERLACGISTWLLRLKVDIPILMLWDVSVQIMCRMPAE